MSDAEDKAGDAKMIEEAEESSRRRSSRAKPAPTAAKKDPKAAKGPAGKKGAPKKDPKGKPAKGGKKKDISSDEEEHSEPVKES